ncbi:MAG: cytochrome d ubiquinol oxidase subunit II [Bacteroidetes bacterium]|nr:MAG: cytochrome d ubiquinol oxidase subunit II [Bacteroidota bacterium]
MFETLSLETLQSYWWIIISLLGGILVFLMFVQGGQTLIYTLGKTETERKILVNALGRKWEFTFTTLVTFGGAFFASFPLFYSTSFGGAYWVWMAILFSFIIQAVAYEYRSKPANFLGSRTYEIFLFVNGALGTILIGVAVSTFFTGSQFTVNKLNLLNPWDSAISRWQGPAHGLEAVLDWRNVAFGLAVFFLSRVLGVLYIANSVSDESINKRLRKQLLVNSLPFLVFFLAWLIAIVTMPGLRVVTGQNDMVIWEPYKYYHNLIGMPVVLIILLAGVILVLSGIILPIVSFARNGSKGIWTSGPGTILTFFAIFCLAGFNNTPFYPSVYDLQSSLTIHNSSSSHYTLAAMSYVSLLIPFVLAYIWYSWRSINRNKIDAVEMGSEGHTY